MIFPFSLQCLPISLFNSLNGIFYFCTTSQFPVDNILDVYDSHDYKPHAGLGRSGQMVCWDPQHDGVEMMHLGGSLHLAFMLWLWPVAFQKLVNNCIITNLLCIYPPYFTC